MSASHQTLPNSYKELLNKYYTFNNSLYYVEDVSNDGKMLLVEDCKTEDLEWVSVELLRKGMKEVKC